MQLDDVLPERLLEQVEPWTSWSRRAWEPGTVLALRELEEAVSWLDAGVLSSGSVDWYRSALRQRIGTDPGLRSGSIKQQIDEILRVPISAGSQAHRRFGRLIDFVDRDYMSAWRDAISTAPQSIELERASRLLSGFVIDHGHHPEWLVKEIRSLAQSTPTALNLLEELAGMCQRKPSVFDGLVVVTHAPELESLMQRPNWVEPARTRDFVETNGHNLEGVNYAGALWFKVKALDPISAAREVEAELTRLVTRTRFRRGRGVLEYLPTFYGRREKVSLNTGRKGVELLTLAKRAYAPTSADEVEARLDDALQLAAPLLGDPDTVAVAGGWAAIESLLITGADASDRTIGRAAAADRAASVITASWPRSELTRLAYRLAGRSSTLPPRLASALANPDDGGRIAGVVLDWLSSGETLRMTNARDVAAVARIEALLANPRPVLGRVRNYITGSLRRLYRQRNLVLHGGAVRPVALNAALRTAAPLVAVAIDRLTFAYVQGGRVPLDAVANAEAAIRSAGDPNAWGLAELAGSHQAR